MIRQNLNSTSSAIKLLSSTAFHNSTVTIGFTVFAAFIGTLIPLNLFFGVYSLVSIAFIIGSLITIAFSMISIYLSLAKNKKIDGKVFFCILIAITFNLLVTSISNFIFSTRYSSVGEVNLMYVQLNHQCPGIDRDKNSMPASRVNDTQVIVLCPTAIMRPSSVFYHTAIIPNIYEF